VEWSWFGDTPVDGRVVFDDPEVEDIKRFNEEYGPWGVGFPNGEADVEAVRLITGNPNFGLPRSKWTNKTYDEYGKPAPMSEPL